MDGRAEVDKAISFLMIQETGVNSLGEGFFEGLQSVGGELMYVCDLCCVVTVFAWTQWS